MEQSNAEKRRYLHLLAQQYPNVRAVSGEIIHLEAILNLPKGTEHFMSDLHGEAEAFVHILNNASGAVREKVDIVLQNSLPADERAQLATLIYYPEEKLEELAGAAPDRAEWYRITLIRLIDICRLTASKYTRAKVHKALPIWNGDIINELLNRDNEVFNKREYFDSVIDTIIETDHAEDFIVSMCNLIKRLVVDHLHIVGDIAGNANRYEVLEQTVIRLVEKHKKLRVVSIGVPGYITNDVIGLCNFIELMGLPLRNMLQEKFPSIKILVENDMNAAAYGFYQGHCMDRDTTIAFIYSPINAQTGIEERLHADPNMPISSEMRTLINLSINFGAGFVSGGRILRGFTGFAGEVSFLPVVRPQDPDPAKASVETMAHIIGSIVPILNPEIIALTGGYFDKKTVEEIYARCLRLIAPQHMPQIILRDNVHDEYVSGLINLALEELSCGVMLVKRRA